MVTEDGKSSAPVLQTALLEYCPAESGHALISTLEELERRDIVRRVTQPGEELSWRLDHDYLAAPVRDIRRRQIPAESDLKSRYQKFQRATPWQKPFALAGPLLLVRLAYARWRRRVSFGEAQTWIWASAASWCLTLSLLFFSASISVERFRGEETARRLFDAVGTDRTTEWGSKTFVELSQSSRSARREFLRLGLASEPTAERLAAHNFEIAIALSRIDRSEVSDFFHRELLPIFSSNAWSIKSLEEALALTRFWDTANLGPSSTEAFASTLVGRMEKPETGELELSYLEAALNAVGGKIRSAEADELASKLVARIEKETDSGKLAHLAAGLGALGPCIQQSRGDELATKLVNSMESKQIGALQLHYLTSALSTLGDKIGPPEIDKAATVIVGRLEEEKNHDALRELAASLDSLSGRIQERKAEELASKLQARLNKETDPQSLYYLAWGLSALKNTVQPSEIDDAAETMVKNMEGKPEDGPTLSWLSAGLTKLKDKVQPQKATELANRLVALMEKTSDRDALGYLAASLNDLNQNIGTATADELASKLVAVLRKLKSNSQTLPELTKALNALCDKMSTLESDEAATMLVEHLEKETDWNSSQAVIVSLDKLKGRTSTTKSEELASRLVSRMRRKETDSTQLTHLAGGLSSLTEKIREPKAEELASMLLTRIQGETDSSSQRELVGGLGTLKAKVQASKIDEAAAILVANMENEKASSYDLDRFARGLAALGDKVQPSKIDDAATVLVTRMAQKRADSSWGLSELTDGLHDLREGIQIPTADKLGSRLVGYMANTTGTDVSDLTTLAASVDALKDKVQPSTIEAAATLLTADIESKDTKANDVDLLGAKLGDLKGKLRTPTIQELASKIVARMKNKETDYVVQSSLAYALDQLPFTSLTSNDIEALRPTLRAAEAPCNVILHVRAEDIREQLIDGIRNPNCTPKSWTALVVAFGNLTGRELTRKVPSASSDQITNVNFLSLADAIKESTPGIYRFRLGLLNSLALLLLVGGTFCAVVALWRGKIARTLHAGD
jgi:hypothetical protein